MGLRVYQIAPHVAQADAVGNQILATHDLLERSGCETRIFADSHDAQLDALVRPTTDYLNEASPDHWLILHYCSCGHANRVARDSRGRLIFYYHNVTPARFFYGYDAVSASCCGQARWQLKEFAGRGPAIAASDYNRAELNALGFDVRAVAPYILQLDGLHANSDAPENTALRNRFAAPATRTWLYVGRIAPNKRVEDIIRAFDYYHRRIEPASRLLLVGSRRNDRYNAEIDDLIRQCELGDAVVFPGPLRASALGVLYRLADLYISLSEHEGFCVPLVEAMSFGLPVLAFDSTAVPGTLGKSGVLLHRKDPPLVAEVAHAIVTDRPLREALVARQTARLEDFAPAAMRLKLLQALIAAGVPLPSHD